MTFFFYQKTLGQTTCYPPYLHFKNKWARAPTLLNGFLLIPLLFGFFIFVFNIFLNSGFIKYFVYI